MSEPSIGFAQSLSRRVRAWAAVLAWLLVAGRSLAAEPDGNGWRDRYEHAKAELAAGKAADAAREFDALAADASTDDERRLAKELAAVAHATAANLAGPSVRNAPGPRVTEVPVPAPTTVPAAPHIRTTDELSVLYTTAFLYGLGTSTWIVLLTKPQSLPGALLPFAGITASAVAGVAAVDGYRPLRRGVPHSIAAGLYLGFGDGVALVGLQHAGAKRRNDDSRWSEEAVATALWSTATLGGATGALVGALREPTPGRVSFTGSTALWSGLTVGLGAAAIEPRDRLRAEMAFGFGAGAYNAGIVTGVLLAPSISPSVARMRFVDLGSVGGGLVGAGIYAIAAGKDATTRAGMGFASLGAASGFGLTLWLTRNMPGDRVVGKATTARVGPTVMPVPGGGFTFGLAGEL